MRAELIGKEKENEAIRESDRARQASALEHERAALLEAETVRDALVCSQQLVLESKPQEALARLAATWRLYSKNRLAATSLFAMLAGSNWPLALTPPIHLKTADRLAVERARFSPDGKRIVTTGWDPTGTSKAYVCEAATGELIMEAEPCNSVGEDYGTHFILLPDEKSFTVDGHYLVIAGARKLASGILPRAKNAGKSLRRALPHCNLPQMTPLFSLALTLAPSFDGLSIRDRNGK